MWRAFFVAIGISCCLLGLEALVIDKAVLNVKTKPAAGSNQQPAPRTLSPPDWAPWSLLSGGTVVLLYSFTIPARNRGGD